MPVQYLLDTTILLHWLRDDAFAARLEQRYALSSSSLRPLICEVSLGEMLAMSRRRQWGEHRCQRLAEMERQVVAVDISNRDVLDAYADLSTLAQSSGWALFHAKNDLWVGTGTQATTSHLLTTDKDFLPLQSLAGWLDSGTAFPA